jgi:endonuclease/exonuclease/phosphatase family metal-dependent hydrolase
MQLVCLNTWGGKRYEALAHFIKGMADKTDVFCFQEVFSAAEEFGPHPNATRLNLLQDISDWLPDFKYAYVPILLGNEYAQEYARDVSMGNAIFFRAALTQERKGSEYLVGAPYELRADDAHKVSLMQYVKLTQGTKSLTVVNIHGIASWPKSDTTARLEQSHRILDFLAGLDGPKLVCGDFNLFPDTKSIAVLGREMKDLTKEYNIPTTRSLFHRERFAGQAVIETVSDYMFVSPDISVTSFTVPDVEVSDHLPLVAEFTL